MLGRANLKTPSYMELLRRYFVLDIDLIPVIASRKEQSNGVHDVLIFFRTRRFSSLLTNFRFVCDFATCPRKGVSARYLSNEECHVTGRLRSRYECPPRRNGRRTGLGECRERARKEDRDRMRKREKERRRRKGKEEKKKKIRRRGLGRTVR